MCVFYLAILQGSPVWSPVYKSDITAAAAAATTTTTTTATTTTTTTTTVIESVKNRFT